MIFPQNIKDNRKCFFCRYNIICKFITQEVSSVVSLLALSMSDIVLMSWEWHVSIFWVGVLGLIVISVGESL